MFFHGKKWVGARGRTARAMIGTTDPWRDPRAGLARPEKASPVSIEIY